MARGFGTTLGVGTTDTITTGLTSDATQRSYSIWTYRSAAGGATFQRILDKTSVIIYDESTTYNFVHVWSVQQGQWTVARPSEAVWHHFGVSYDGGATANDPDMYMDGVLQTETRFEAPSGTLTTDAVAYSLGNRASDQIRNWGGSLAEFAVWDALLTAAEFKALGAGYSPLLIRPQSLVEYVPMMRDNVSRKRGVPTITGTAIQPHPLIMMPRRRGIFGISAGAPGVFVLDAAPGAFSVTGTAATLAAARFLDAAAGSYTISGFAATLLHQALQHYVLDAAPGVFSITAPPAFFDVPSAVLNEEYWLPDPQFTEVESTLFYKKYGIRLAPLTPRAAQAAVVASGHWWARRKRVL